MLFLIGDATADYATIITQGGAVGLLFLVLWFLKDHIRTIVKTFTDDSAAQRKTFAEESQKQREMFKSEQDASRKQFADELSKQRHSFVEQLNARDLRERERDKEMIEKLLEYPRKAH
jgi:flagellar biosynthesis/type III secretory pathway M-ring protein FliF/YscJ